MSEWTSAKNPLPLLKASQRLSPKQNELIPRLANRLLSLKPMRWKTLTNYARGGLDIVDVETVAWALHRAGWIEVEQRRNTKGETLPNRLRLLESAVEDAAAKVGAESPSQRQIRIEKLLAVLRARDLNSPPVPERVLVREVFGTTKAVRLREYRVELEAQLGFKLQRLVRFHVDCVLTAGPVQYRFNNIDVDLRASAPWSAVTEPVVEELTDFVVDGVQEVICVENQTPFESLLYEGAAQQAVVMFTSGYLGTVQRRWLTHLVRSGVRRVRHWGDLDPWGLDIYRTLRDHVRSVDLDVIVEPWRMEPEPLQRPDAQKLSTEDWIALHRYLKREDAPLLETAKAMKKIGRKLEQEALL